MLSLVALQVVSSRLHRVVRPTSYAGNCPSVPRFGAECGGTRAGVTGVLPEAPHLHLVAAGHLVARVRRLRRGLAVAMR